MDVKSIVSIDLETTGTDPLRCLPIQLGLSVWREDMQFETFEQDINWSLGELNSPQVQPEALKVNGLTLDRISGIHGTDEDFRSMHSTCLDGYKFLENQVGEIGPRSLVGLGWNVAGFDLVILRRFKAPLSNEFHYRSVDLNSVCLTIAKGDPQHYEGLKNDAKEYGGEKAVENLYGSDGLAVGEQTWHSAGFDALAALYSWRYLIQDIYRGRS